MTSSTSSTSTTSTRSTTGTTGTTGTAGTTGTTSAGHDEYEKQGEATWAECAAHTGSYECCGC
ncbi:hypothetical protein KUF83_25680 [Streptomyces sp. BV286]|uniref:hypothetical protein n=1 Tax=Streptomyces sp. BV286 TaxID=2849672 RepID=UPI001C2E835F|nr:hypothetical protein [Streptomyces sp. BV286]MBV1939931.1 hypothetical protein [Streptomyces sp. BV286]